jgi:hypothetical protein
MRLDNFRNETTARTFRYRAYLSILKQAIVTLHPNQLRR